MTEMGITAYGAYVPRLRIDRSLIAKAHSWAMPGLRAQARGSRAFTNWDEDAITMAVEAARDALGTGETDNIPGLRLASTRFPYADLQNAAIVASAIGLPRQAATSDTGGSQRAGTTALLQALKSNEASLVVGSDAPAAKAASLQELSFGAGAAALVVGSGKVIARLIGSATISTVFVDHFRASDVSTDYGWEERWIRDEGYARIVPEGAAAALVDAGLCIGDIQHFVMPSYLRGAAEAVARTLKFGGTVASGLDDGVGYTGAAHPLLMLCKVLEDVKPGERILLVGFGQGTDVLILEATDEIASRRPARGVSGAMADALATDSYLRMLSFGDGIDMDWGMRSERSAKTALTEQYRSAAQMEGFVAGKCEACETIQFPQLQFCVNCKAPRDQFEPVSLIDAPARVLTSTSDWLSYHPSPPLSVGFVQFDNGARVLMEMVDLDPSGGGVEPGQPLRMVFRIKERDRQRGYNRYFWKSTPLLAA